MDKEIEHKQRSAVRMANGDWRTECTCGAWWTQRKESSPEHLQSIFESHVKYFNNKTLVL